MAECRDISKQDLKFTAPPGIGFELPHLHTVLDLPGVVSDDESRLHDSRKLDVAVSFVLSLELVQQCLVGGLWEAV